MSTIGTVIGTHGSYTFFKGLKITPQVTAAVSEDKSVNLIKRGSVSVSSAVGVDPDDKNENKSELCVNNSNKNNSGTDNELKLSADR